jgi:glycosyltransferase involved in cell wall biosynthesis
MVARRKVAANGGRGQAMQGSPAALFPQARPPLVAQDMNDIADQVREKQVVNARTGPAILQVLPELGEGGAERGTVDLARYLIREGCTALFASAGGRAEAELEELGGTSLRLPVHSKNPFTMRTNVRRLERVIHEHGVQLVHARSRAPAWSAYYATRRCKVPFVTTFHGVYEGSAGIFKRRYNAIMARGERVIAISDFVAEHVRERYRVPPERLRVIPRGVDMTAFDPAAVSEDRRRLWAVRWRLTAGTKVVMLPGRLVRRKGHALLMRAIERLRRRDVVCLMVGDIDASSSYVGEIEGMIGATGLREVVRMVGPCDDMPAALTLADVVVVPSTAAPEPFGRVSIEAQAMGKPVIATDFGGLGETLMPAATGWLVPPDDVDELADALQLALTMPDDARARLAVRARRFVTRNFTLERMGKSTLDVYRELLEARAPKTDLIGMRGTGA